MKKLNNPSKNQPGKKGRSVQAAPKSLEELPLEQLPQDALDIVNSVPERMKREVALAFFSLKSHSGPLPSPETLAGYENAQSGAADRVITMAEKQQNHRMDLEKIAIRRQFNQSSAGQWIAAILAISFLGGSVYLGINGHDVLAGTLGGTTIIALVTVFITGKNSMQNSTKEKS